MLPKLQDRMVVFFGKTFPFKVEHQKRALEGLPMVLGFMFDVATLSRIDQLWSLLQQIIFIVCIFFFLILDNVPVERRTRFKLMWKYYDYIMQFFFGGLLSAYSIFYFKSASSFAVILFAFVLFVLMVINESKRFHSLNFPVRYVLTSLCLASFMAYFVPILLHFVNWFSFLLSMMISFLLYAGFIHWLHKNMTLQDQPKRKRFLWGSYVPLFFTILYFLKLIPLVPLSCTEIGVYHNVTKQNGEYQLEYTRPSWKFWEKGDQSFSYRNGDRVYIFTSVFAPTDLKHKIQIRFEKYDDRSKEWLTTDMIPMPIKGGRDDGYRGFAFKQSITEGEWRVRVETEEGGELRRLEFDVEPDSHPQEERIVKIKKS